MKLKTYFQKLFFPKRFAVLSLTKELFYTKKLLFRMTEIQLVIIAKKLGITATTDDLKRDTVDKIWETLYMK